MALGNDLTPRVWNQTTAKADDSQVESSSTIRYSDPRNKIYHHCFLIWFVASLDQVIIRNSDDMLPNI